MKLSEKIIYLRKKNGMSQEELANALNVSRQSISRWEVGSALPDAVNILNLSKLFDVTADYLLNDEYEKEFSLNTKTNTKTNPRKKQCIIGYVCIGLAIIWVFILAILSLVDPAVYEIVRFDGPDVVYEGITGYVMVNDAQWIVGLIILLILVGIVCIFNAKIMSFLKKAKEKGIIF